MSNVLAACHPLPVCCQNVSKKLGFTPASNLMILLRAIPNKEVTCHWWHCGSLWHFPFVSRSLPRTLWDPTFWFSSKVSAKASQYLWDPEIISRSIESIESIGFKASKGQRFIQLLSLSTVWTATQLPIPGSLCYIIRPSQIIELLRGWDAAYWYSSIWCVSSRNKCLSEFLDPVFRVRFDWKNITAYHCY